MIRFSMARHTKSFQEMGQKRLRGIPVHYDEVKRNRGFRLTDTAYEAIRKAAKAEGLSLGELVERWARGLNPREGG